MRPWFWGWGGGEWWLVLVGGLLWVGLVVAVVLLLRRELPNLSSRGSQRSPALQLLEERYARGEIGRDEFFRRRAVLLGEVAAPATPAAPPEPPRRPEPQASGPTDDAVSEPPTVRTFRRPDVRSRPEIGPDDPGEGGTAPTQQLPQPPPAT